MLMFSTISLDDAHHISLTVFPVPELREANFEELWNLHPPDFHELLMHGRLVKTPRWQQAHSLVFLTSMGGIVAPTDKK